MMGNGPVSIWYLPVGLQEYKPGMELGKPDEIIPAISIIESKKKQFRKIK